MCFRGPSITVLVQSESCLWCRCASTTTTARSPPRSGPWASRLPTACLSGRWRWKATRPLRSRRPEIFDVRWAEVVARPKACGSRARDGFRKLRFQKERKPGSLFDIFFKKSIGKNTSRKTGCHPQGEAVKQSYSGIRLLISGVVYRDPGKGAGAGQPAVNTKRTMSLISEPRTISPIDLGGIKTFERHWGGLVGKQLLFVAEARVHSSADRSNCSDDRKEETRKLIPKAFDWWTPSQFWNDAPILGSLRPKEGISTFPSVVGYQKTEKAASYAGFRGVSWRWGHLQVGPGVVNPLPNNALPPLK